MSGEGDQLTGAAMACPQFAQNLAVRGFCVPHSAQKMVSDAADGAEEFVALFVGGVEVESSSLEALRNSRTLFPMAPPTSGRRPAPKIKSTMTRISPSSGKPS